MAGVKKPMSSMSASVPAAIARIASPLRNVAVDDADVGDHAAVLVELGVEDQRARRRVGVARAGGGTRATSSSSTSATPSPVLAQMRRTLVRVLADQLGDLLGDALGLGARQVDLVQRGISSRPGVDRQVGVGDGLGLDALRGVDHQQRALARGQASARPRR